MRKKREEVQRPLSFFLKKEHLVSSIILSSFIWSLIQFFFSYWCAQQRILCDTEVLFMPIWIFFSYLMILATGSFDRGGAAIGTQFENSRIDGQVFPVPAPYEFPNWLHFQSSSSLGVYNIIILIDVFTGIAHNRAGLELFQKGSDARPWSVPLVGELMRELVVHVCD